MEQKPNLVYILIILWVVIGILFLGLLITYMTNYLDQIGSMGGAPLGDSQWQTMMNFSFAMYFILFLSITAFSFLLAYGSYMKKNWSWLIGIMTASFLGFFIFLGIQSIGTLIIMDYSDQIFSTTYSSYQYISYILLIFLVPCMLFIIIRPEVKTYFGKT